ncbi:hypothetical protein VUR80DRAFT_9339 [Thermomyces stellatus]
MRLGILAMLSLAAGALSSPAPDSDPEYKCWVNRPGQCESLCANGDDTVDCSASLCIPNNWSIIGTCQCRCS